MAYTTIRKESFLLRFGRTSPVKVASEEVSK